MSTEQPTFDLDAISTLPIRPELRSKSPYGAPQIDVPYMLNTNENTHRIPGVVADAIVKAVEAVAGDLNRYPDREFTALREKLAQYLGQGMTASNIWAANGSNEILQQILQAFGGPGRRLLSFPPTYSMYPILASITNTQYIAGYRLEDFTLTADSVSQQIKDNAPDVVFLCSPNNPTGTALDLEIVEAAYEAGEEYQSVIVVDQAYEEFSSDGGKSTLALLSGRQRLIVTRTMSKAFAMAGLRLGYLAAAPEIADALRLVRLPYHLSAITQAASMAALDHSDELLKAVHDIKQQRDRIVRELLQLGLTPAESDSNSVLFGGMEDSSWVWRQLLDQGVLIRDVGIDNHLRVTAGTEEETTAFLTAMRTIVSSDAS